MHQSKAKRTRYKLPLGEPFGDTCGEQCYAHGNKENRLHSIVVIWWKWAVLIILSYIKSS